MKEYPTLTRAKVDVDPSAVRYFDVKLSMLDVSDKLLDLILNGPTLNGINKDTIRSMLRETYAELKRYETIGLMASPFVNDPAAIVAHAFNELYPGVEYRAQLVPDLHNEEGGEVYGETIFPDDGYPPVISISAVAPAADVPELLAHELAHVVAGIEAGHGPEWEAIEDALHAKYNEINNYTIPDAAEHDD